MSSEQENPSEAWTPELPEPPRPAHVPATAKWEDEGWRWSAGPVDANGNRRGAWRFWAMNGTLIAERKYDAGVELSVVSHHPSGVLAARTLRQSDGTTTHDCYWPNGKPWVSVRYLGDLRDGLATAKDVVSEKIYGKDGKLRRDIVNERDSEGLVRHVEKAADGTIRFENVRLLSGGSELRFFDPKGEPELALRLGRDGKKGVAVLGREGGREVAIELAEPAFDARRSDIEGDIGGVLFAATIESMPRPELIKAFAAKNAWAEKISEDAPFAHASIANFLTGLGSTLMNVPSVSMLGIRNLSKEKQAPKILALLEELSEVEGYGPGAKRALAELDPDAEPEKGEDDDDGDTGYNPEDHAPGKEHAIGKVSLPTGDLVIVDMGAMSQWSHDKPHHADSSGSTWAGAMGAKRDDYVDMVVTGPDAKAALVELARAHEWSIGFFDIRRDTVEETQKHFKEHSGELDAKLEIAPERIGHGQRIRMMKDAGFAYGEFELAHVNVICVFGLTKNRDLDVVGVHDDEGQWDRVSLVCKKTPPASEEKIGSLSVEEARLMFADSEALAHWDHERSIDGLRDIVFWGGAEDDLAAELFAETAYSAADYLGWADLPPGAIPPHFFGRIAEASEAGQLSVELRPHSTHHAILRGAWSSPDEVGTATIGGAKMCGLFSSVGDGVFPVYLERDAEGDICRVTVKITGAPEKEEEDESDDEEEEEDEDESDDEEEDEDDGQKTNKTMRKATIRTSTARPGTRGPRQERSLCAAFLEIVDKEGESEEDLEEDVRSPALANLEGARHPRLGKRGAQQERHLAGGCDGQHPRGRHGKRDLRTRVRARASIAGSSGTPSTSRSAGSAVRA